MQNKITPQYCSICVEQLTTYSRVNISPNFPYIFESVPPTPQPSAVANPPQSTVACSYDRTKSSYPTVLANHLSVSHTPIRRATEATLNA